jgi:hypothetical protein
MLISAPVLFGFEAKGEQRIPITHVRCERMSFHLT